MLENYFMDRSVTHYLKILFRFCVYTASLTWTYTWRCIQREMQQVNIW